MVVLAYAAQPYWSICKHENGGVVVDNIADLNILADNMSISLQTEVELAYLGTKSRLYILASAKILFRDFFVIIWSSNRVIKRSGLQVL